MNHAIEVHLAANIDKYQAGMDAAKKMGTESLGFIASIFDKIKTMFSGLWDSFKSFFSGGTDKFKSAFGSMSDSASGAFQKLSGYFSGFNSDLDKSKAKMGETEEQSSSLASKVGTGLVAAFAAAAVAVTAFTAKGLMVDATYAGIAISSGVAVSQISRFEGAAARSGVGVKDLGTSMAKFREEMTKAAAGDGSDAFTKMGVKVADSNNALLKTDDVLVDVSKKIAGMSTEAEKYAAAAKLGFDGKVQVLEDIAHASDLSARVTDEQAAAVKRLGAIWHEILPAGRSMWSTISDKLTNSLTPAMTDMSVAVLESKNRIVEAFSQMYGGGSSFLDKLGDKIRDWSKSAGTWFSGVAKSATDMTVSLMQYVAGKTGLGDPGALKPTGTGYVPGLNPLTSNKADPVTKTADAEALKQYNDMTKAIKEKIAAQQLEAQTGQALTDGQRMAIQFSTALRDGTLQLTDAQKQERAAQLATLISQEQSNKAMQDARAASAAADKKEEEQYASLIASIQSKIDIDKIELAVGSASTESQKLQAKMDAELASGKLKLSAAHIAAARAKLQELAASEQLLKIAQAQREVTKYIEESRIARDQQNAALAVEYAMYGKTADARAIAIVAVDAETWKERELAKLRADKLPITDKVIDQLNAERDARTQVGQATLAQTKALQYAAQLADENKKFGIDYIVDDKARAAAQLAIDSDVWKERIRLAGDGTKAQQVLQEQFDTWYQNQSMKPALEQQKQMWTSVEQTAHDTFISIFDSGKSAFDRLRDTLKNGLLELLYQMTVKQWIFNIGASVGMSGSGAVSQATGLTNVGDSAGGAGGISGLIGKAQNASSLYKAISGNLFDGAGSAIASLGNYAGSSSLSAFGAGFAGNTAGTTMSASEMFANAGMANEAAMAGYGQMASTAAGYGAGLIGGHYVGNAIAGDYSMAHGQTVTNVAAAIGTAIAGPLGGVVGGALGGVANRAFGMGNKEVQTTGISGTLSSTGTTAESYSKWHQKGGWFRSNKDGTDTTDFSSDTIAALTNGLTQLKAVSSSFAASLGVDATSIASYSKTFDIDLGKDGNISDGITKLFTTVGDELATQLVPNVMQFSKTGETASATLQRLAGDFDATTQMAHLIGKTAAEAFGTAGIASAAAREQLVNLAGSASSLTSMASSYAQNYLTEGQRLAPVKKAVDEAMSSLGLAGVKTREQFKQVIDSLDLTSEAGARQYVSMMQLSDAFAQVHAASATLAKTEAQIADERKGLQDQLDQLTMTSAALLAKQRDALDDSNKALFDQVQAAQKVKAAQDAAKTSLGNFITQMKSFATTAAGLNNSLVLGSLSTLTPEQQYTEARRQFELTRQQAAAGDTTAQGNLQSVEQTFLQLSQKLNGGDAQYSSDLATVMHTNDQLAQWATQSVNVAQSSLDALNNSAVTLTDISATLKAIATGVQYLPAALSGKDLAQFTQSFKPIDFSRMGALDMAPLVSEIKSLREEVRALRADQQRQTGDLIQASAASTQHAAETVVDGMRAAVTDAAYAGANSTRELK